MADTSPWRKSKPCRVPRDQISLIDYFPGTGTPKLNIPPRVLEATTAFFSKREERRGHDKKLGAYQQSPGAPPSSVQAGQKPKCDNHNLQASLPPARLGKPERPLLPNEKDEQKDVLRLNEEEEEEEGEEEQSGNGRKDEKVGKKQRTPTSWPPTPSQRQGQFEHSEDSIGTSDDDLCHAAPAPRKPLVPRNRQAPPATEDSEPDELDIEPPAGFLASVREGVNIHAVPYNQVKLASPSSQMSAPPCGQRAPPTQSSPPPSGPKKNKKLAKSSDAPRQKHRRMVSAFAKGEVARVSRETRSSSPSASFSSTSSFSAYTSHTPRGKRKLETLQAGSSERPRKAQAVQDPTPAGADSETPHEPPSIVEIPSQPRPRNDSPSSTVTATKLPGGQQESTDAASETGMSYDVFCIHYPGYRGSIDDFVRACVTLDNLQKPYPCAVHEGFYDTFIHSYVGFLGYLKEVESKGGTPKKIIDWFYRVAKRPVGVDWIVTSKNLKSVFVAHAHKYRLAMNILEAGNNRRSSTDTRLGMEEETATDDRESEKLSAVLLEDNPKVILATPSQQWRASQKQPTPEGTLQPDDASVVAETPEAITESADAEDAWQAKSHTQSALPRPINNVALSGSPISGYQGTKYASPGTTQTINLGQPVRDAVQTMDDSSRDRRASSALEQDERREDSEQEPQISSRIQTPRDQIWLPASSQPTTPASFPRQSTSGSWHKRYRSSTKRAEKDTSAHQQTPTQVPALSQAGASAKSPASVGMLGDKPSIMPPMTDSRSRPNLTPRTAHGTDGTFASRCRATQHSSPKPVIPSTPLANLVRADASKFEVAAKSPRSISHASTQTTPTPPRKLQATPTPAVHKPQATLAEPPLAVKEACHGPPASAVTSTATLKAPPAESLKVIKKPQSPPILRIPKTPSTARQSAAKVANPLDGVATGRVEKKKSGRAAKKNLPLAERWAGLLKTCDIMWARKEKE